MCVCACVSLVPRPPRPRGYEAMHVYKNAIYSTLLTQTANSIIAENVIVRYCQ